MTKSHYEPEPEPSPPPAITLASAMMHHALASFQAQVDATARASSAHENGRPGRTNFGDRPPRSRADLNELLRDVITLALEEGDHGGAGAMPSCGPRTWPPPSRGGPPDEGGPTN